MSRGVNRGKKFEQKFLKNWFESFPTSFCLRLPDQQSGYRASRNICDFITFESGKLFLIELKSIHGNTLPMSNLRQFDDLLQESEKPHVYPGVIVWWVDLDKIAWVPIKEIQKMKQDNKKSIHVNMLNSQEYNLLDLPSIKKRVFLDTDYTKLKYL